MANFSSNSSPITEVQKTPIKRDSAGIHPAADLYDEKKTNKSSASFQALETVHESDWKD